MLFLALAIACSTAIAIIFKVTEGRFDRMALLAVNYAAAFLLAAFRLSLEPVAPHLAEEAGLIALGAGVGVLFVTGFFLFSRAIGLAGMSIATATMRLSVAMPFLASWLIWHEVPTTGQTIGLFVAAAAFILISRKPAPETTADLPPEPVSADRAGPLAIFVILLLLFVVGGVVDTSMKFFEEQFGEAGSRQLFMVLVFGVAGLLAGGSVVLRRVRGGQWPPLSVAGWGTLLGAVNYGSVEFILLALRQLPGTLVFPANNVAIIAAATLIGVLVWRERLSRMNLVGLVLALVALILLTY